MTLNPGTRLGPYEILSPLGAGGMGEVFRARDARLGRDVAIKALPAEFAQDPERLARFEREARLLASLSHPNIAGIFGVEEAAGTRYLVLEFVDGETLSARLARGPLPLDEVLDVARQIAAGVEAAHESGVIHRDLKPGNVMLTPDGGVKVLDFGLARSGGGEGSTSDPNLTSSPTRTYAATQAGIVLGTAAYMSPEQARGKRVDRRTDIWSFGCVLFECLEGRALFEGETVSDLIARILQTEPEWNRLPAETPPRVRALLKRCLRRDPRERLRDIGDARLEIADVIAGVPDASAPATPSRRGAGVWPWVAAVCAALAVALGVTLARKQADPLPLLRLNLLEPGLLTDVNPGNYAISPDGSALAFIARREGVAEDAPRVFVREMDKPTARMLEGTEGASMPFWSRDSRNIAFFAEETLRRVPAVGGGVQNLCDVVNARGGSWGDGEIVFAASAQSPLYRVSDAGGSAVPVTAFDSTHAEDSHRFPTFLPDGRHFLFIAQGASEEREFRLRIGSLDEAVATLLQIQGDNATFAAPDRVVFVRDQAAMAQRIDMQSFATVGPAVLLDTHCNPGGRIASSPVGSASENGILVLASKFDRPTSLEWAYPDGRVEAVADLAEYLLGAELSPDASRVAFMRNESPGNSTWVYDIAQKSLTQVMKRDRGIRTPIWDPSGGKLAGLFVNEGRNEPRVLDLASGLDSLIAPTGNEWGIITDWAQSGNVVLFGRLAKGRGMDIVYAPMSETRTFHEYLATPANESSAVLSPDGRWIAYWTDATGTWDLVVDSFPVKSGARRLATGAGPAASATVWSCRAWWSAVGRSVIYTRPGDDEIKIIDVRTDPTLSLGPPRTLQVVSGEAYGVDYDPAGHRFLVARPIGANTRSFIVIQNWTRQLDATE